MSDHQWTMLFDCAAAVFAGANYFILLTIARRLGRIADALEARK